MASRIRVSFRHARVSATFLQLACGRQRRACRHSPKSNRHLSTYSLVNQNSAHFVRVSGGAVRAPRSAKSFRTPTPSNRVPSWPGLIDTRLAAALGREACKPPVRPEGTGPRFSAARAASRPKERPVADRGGFQPLPAQPAQPKAAPGNGVARRFPSARCSASPPTPNSATARLAVITGQTGAL